MNSKKKPYKKSEVKKVTIDNEISMVMMSAFGPGSRKQHEFAEPAKVVEIA